MPEKTSETAWIRMCPHCGARIQPVARQCWQCGAQLDEPDSQRLDYQPTNPEEVTALSVAILTALAIVLPILLLVWLISLIPF
jgi:predicted amidophosphoribosyltransferase